MKYLSYFLENLQYKMLSEIDDIKYIMNDEGFKVVTYPHPKYFKGNSLRLEISKSVSVPLRVKFWEEEFYIEFINRVREICNRNGYEFHKENNVNYIIMSKKLEKLNPED